MTSAPANHRQAGFTLVEILVVLAITAVVFGLSALSLSVLRQQASPTTLASATVRLLNHVRDGAAARVRPTSATIDMKTKTISSDFDDPVKFPDTFKLVVAVGRETVANTELLQVQFLPDGTSSGVRIAISDPAGRKVRVETNWLTGLTRAFDAGK